MQWIGAFFEKKKSDCGVSASFQSFSGIFAIRLESVWFVFDHTGGVH